MNLVEQYKADLVSITTDTNDFAISMNITNETDSLDFNGFFTEHNDSFDLDNMEATNDRVASVAIAEKLLVDAGYPYTNSDGDVLLLDHVVTVSDSSGGSKQMIVRENKPDRNIGLIILMLGEYGAD